MKKVLLFGCALIMAGSLFANKPINEKVLKIFNQTFAEAQNVIWSDEKDIYVVKFTKQGIRTTVNYDIEGNFLTSLRYYSGADLPIDIQCKLKKKYAGKRIFGVTEYTIGDQVNYYVKLEDEKTWTTVKVDENRNMEVTEKFKKI